MKKFRFATLILVALSMLLVPLAACGGDSGSTGTTQPAATQPAATEPAATEPATTEPLSTGSSGDDTFELALITDLGTIDDGGFNQGSWEGLVQYATEFGISHKYYQPADQGDDFYLNTIDLAVQGGAKVIVTPGFLFEVPIFVAQERYPDVKFILLDAQPQDGEYNYMVGSNTVAVLYAEEQSGFLAGYAAVHDGYTSLGFLGGMAVPAVVRFGHGFVQGAEVAAKELDLADGSISINYHYTGTFAPAPEIQTMAAAWYNDGVEAIFVCGGGIVYSVLPAAEQAGAYIIGVDTDQHALSDTVITSAMKLLQKSVYDKIADFYAGAFPGGETVIYSADNLGVGLPMENSRFNTFNQAMYDAMYAKLASGEVVVDNRSDVSVDALSTSAVVVNNIS